MRFNSRYDWWLVLIFVSGIFTFLFVAALVYPTLLSFIFIIPALLLGWIYFGTFYTVLKDRVIIRSGPLKWTVLTSDIIYIEPTHNPLSAPALSLDRLFIKYKKGFITVSPKDKAGFIQLLLERNHNINIKRKDNK